MHGLKEILSHEAIMKAVDYIWNVGIFLTNSKLTKFFRRFNVPKVLFFVNFLLDLLFFMLLSLMMLTTMCVKAKV